MHQMPHMTKMEPLSPLNAANGLKGDYTSIVWEEITRMLLFLPKEETLEPRSTSTAPSVEGLEVSYVPVVGRSA